MPGGDIGATTTTSEVVDDELLKKISLTFELESTGRHDEAILHYDSDNETVQLDVAEMLAKNGFIDEAKKLLSETQGDTAETS